MSAVRPDGRRPDQLRPLVLKRHFLRHAAGSVWVEAGDTWVLCAATVEDRVPPWLKGSGQGWVTAEYGMLPRSTAERHPREGPGRTSGRTYEIQRLIGRSLRAVTNLPALGERTVTLDCDVIQADGGTRTAAVTGAFVALVDALDGLRREGVLEELPVADLVAAISVGVVDGVAVADLCYAEDVRARVDMNVVLTGAGELVEVQGSGEQAPFAWAELDRLLELARRVMPRVFQVQREVLGELAERIGRVPRAEPPPEPAVGTEPGGR